MLQRTNKLLKSSCILLLCLLLSCITPSQAQTLDTNLYEGLIFGMGWGTFLILIFIIIGAILIFFRKMFPYEFIMIIIAISLPLFTFLILLAWPKKSTSATTTTTTFDDPTHFYLLKIGLCFTFACIFFLFAIFALLYATVFRFVYARREDTARIEKFKRTKDIDSDDEEEEAAEMKDYDLEEEEEEEERSIVASLAEEDLGDIDEDERLVNN